MNLKSIFVTAAAAALSVPAMAQVYTTTGWAGGDPRNTTIGVSFTPSADASLTDLGSFHYNGYVAYTAKLEVWEQGVATPLGSVDITVTASTPAGPDVAGQPFNYVFANRDLSLGFAPVSLVAGHNYAVTLTGTAGTFNRNSNPGSSNTETPGVLTLTGTINEGVIGTSNPFDLGFASYSGNFGSLNFIIGAAAVPEPSEYAAAAGLGLVAFAAFRKFRR